MKVRSFQHGTVIAQFGNDDIGTCKGHEAAVQTDGRSVVIDIIITIRVIGKSGELVVPYTRSSKALFTTIL